MSRGEAGSGGVGPVGAVLLTILILAVARVLFHVDLIGYLSQAVDWTTEVLTDLVDAIGDNRG